MNRRRYLEKIGAGLSVGMAGLAGCGAPGEDAGTATEEPGNGTEVEETELTETGTEGEGGTETGDETETADGTETGEDTETGDGTGGGQGGETTVEMVTEDGEYYFDPIGLHVEPGTEVTWNNQSGSHSSTAYVEDNPQASVRRIPEDAEGWNSETISEEGGTFSHTFEVEGTYDYYCIPHKSLEMVGRIVVGEPSGVDGSPPDGDVPDEQTIVDQGSVAYDEFQSGG